MNNSFGMPADPNFLQGDEKLLALFSHLSLFVGGILLPIIFWATNREKSKFVTFHSLQSLWFHVAYIVILVVFILFFALAIVIGGAGLGLLAGASGGGEMPVFLIIIMVAFYALLFAVIFGAIGYSVYMGIQSYKGKLIKYPVIGKMVYKHVYGNS